MNKQELRKDTLIDVVKFLHGGNMITEYPPQKITKKYMASGKQKHTSRGYEPSRNPRGNWDSIPSKLYES